MSIPRPHFLLFSDTVSDPDPVPHAKTRQGGAWRFILEAVDGEEKLEVEDEEPNARGDRLDLLAVVRGLEALDQPSRVTLVTSSRYVARGFRHGLQEWRENGWQWECFGQMAPVRNGDLWQRIDRALRYHRVDCRTMGARREETDGATTLQQQSSNETLDRSSKATRLATCVEHASKSTRWGWGKLETFVRPLTAALAPRTAAMSLSTARANFS